MKIRKLINMNPSMKKYLTHFHEKKKQFCGSSLKIIQRGRSRRNSEMYRLM